MTWTWGATPIAATASCENCSGLLTHMGAELRSIGDSTDKVCPNQVLDSIWPDNASVPESPMPNDRATDQHAGHCSNEGCARTRAELRNYRSPSSR